MDKLEQAFELLVERWPSTRTPPSFELFMQACMDVQHATGDVDVLRVARDLVQGHWPQPQPPAVSR